MSRADGRNTASAGTLSKPKTSSTISIRSANAQRFFILYGVRCMICSRFQLRGFEMYVPVLWACYVRTPTSDFTFIYLGGCTTCFRFDMYHTCTTFGLFYFSLGYSSINTTTPE